MLSKLHKNTILTGAVDCYCLVCDNYLRSEDEAFTHTNKPIHKKNLGTSIQVEKFKDDHIIKIKNRYYCPFCNILLSTTTKVTIHINNTNHQEMKGQQMLSRVGDNIIAFDEVVITPESWHGLIDDTCVVCNIEFDDSKHRTERSHMLKLVQSKCEFGLKYVYRKVDEDSFFCLTCGSVFPINNKLNHHENTTHKNLYISAKELKNKIPPQAKMTIKTEIPKKQVDNIKNADINKTDRDNNKSKPEVKAKQGSLIDPKTIKDGKIIVSLTKDQATAKLVDSHNIDENQKKPENVNDTTAASKNSVKTPINMGSDNENQSNILDRVDEFQMKGISINFTSNNARCKCCNEYLPFEAASIERHIDERHTNKKKTECIEPKPDLKKESKILDTNAVKADTKKINIGEQKIDSQQPKKSDISDEVKTDTKKIDNSVEPRTDKNKLANVVEIKADTKKQSKKLDSLENRELSVSLLEKKTHDASEPKSSKKKDNKVSRLKLEVAKQTKKTQKVLDITIRVIPENGIKPDTNVIMQEIDNKLKMNFKQETFKKKKNRNDLLDLKTPEFVSMEQYLMILLEVEICLSLEYIVNHEYAIKRNSYHCIMTKGDKYRCKLCDAIVWNSDKQLDVTMYGRDQLIQHINEPYHKENLVSCKFVSSLPDEFIREIVPGTYHCGYCNMFCDGWEKILQHILSKPHLSCWEHGQWSFQRCVDNMRSYSPMKISDLSAIKYT